MKIDDVKNICVVGAGNMGHQISLLCAIHGFNTICTDVSGEALEKAEAFADKYLKGRVKKGKMTEEQARLARENISFTPDLEKAVKETDYVIEAIMESLEIKREIFAELDRLAPAHAILSTNSSRIVSSRIADATNRPSQVLNLHFNNPALVMKLVEVVTGPHVSRETAQVSMDLCEKLNKIAVLQKKEIEGFCLGKIVRAVTDSALWAHEMGVATAEDIDKVCVHGLGHPMGPFRLMDLVGIDLEYRIGMEKFAQTGNPRDLPYPSVVEKYVKGHYGEKTGKGWYDYSKD